MKKIILLLTLIYTYSFAILPISYLGNGIFKMVSTNLCYKIGSFVGNVYKEGPYITATLDNFTSSYFRYDASGSVPGAIPPFIILKGPSVPVWGSQESYYFATLVDCSLASAPTCSENEELVDGQCVPKCPENSHRSSTDSSKCLCNTDYVPNLDDMNTCMKAIEDIIDGSCPAGYVGIKGACYTPYSCSDPDTYLFPANGGYACVSSNALPDMSEPDPNGQPKDYCYNAFNRYGMNEVENCRSCVDVCGGVSNTSFFITGTLVSFSTCTCYDGKDPSNPSVGSDVNDSNNDGSIDDYEVVKILTDTQNNTLDPMLQNSSKLLVKTQEINNQLQTTIELAKKTNDTLLDIKDTGEAINIKMKDLETAVTGVKTQVQETGNVITMRLEGIADKTDSTNNYLEQLNAINQANLDYNKKVFDDLNSSKYNHAFSNPADSNHTLHFCPSCPIGFHDWGGTCYKTGGTITERIPCPTGMELKNPPTERPDDGSPDGSPDGNSTTPDDGDDNTTQEGSCGMFAPLVPDSLEGVVCGSDNLDDFLKDKLFDDSWYDENSIKVSFAPNVPCYLETFSIDIAGKSYPVISEERLSIIPFDLIANLLISLIYIAGISAFLRDS